jgi:citrate/tricarballylate utilization protein
MRSVDSLPLPLLRDGERAMRICSACRYCEGFCAVFPAMERRRSFSPADLTYSRTSATIAASATICQYAPPPVRSQPPCVLAS